MSLPLASLERVTAVGQPHSATLPPLDADEEAGASVGAAATVCGVDALGAAGMGAQAAKPAPAAINPVVRKN